MALDSRNTNNRGEQGIAMLEFALCVPIIVLFFAAVLDLGKYNRERMILNRVSAELARYGSVLTDVTECSTNCSSQAGHSDIATRAQATLTAAGFNMSNITVSTVRTGTAAANASEHYLLTVTIDSQFQGYGIAAPMGMVLGTLSVSATQPWVPGFGAI